MPDEVRTEAERELKRLERLPAAAPDYHVIRTYLEWILDLPWRKQTDDNLDLKHAREVLDEDHYDLEEIKDRILEHLAVIKLNPKTKAPILCFVGPPGVGKTSLGQSIGRAMGRKFEFWSGRTQRRLRNRDGSFRSRFMAKPAMGRPIFTG